MRKVALQILLWSRSYFADHLQGWPPWRRYFSGRWPDPKRDRTSQRARPSSLNVAQYTSRFREFSPPLLYGAPVLHQPSSTDILADLFICMFSTPSAPVCMHRPVLTRTYLDRTRLRILLSSSRRFCSALARRCSPSALRSHIGVKFYASWQPFLAYTGEYSLHHDHSRHVHRARRVLLAPRRLRK